GPAIRCFAEIAGWVAHHRDLAEGLVDTLGLNGIRRPILRAFSKLDAMNLIVSGSSLEEPITGCAQVRGCYDLELGIIVIVKALCLLIGKGLAINYRSHKGTGDHSLPAEWIDGAEQVVNVADRRLVAIHIGLAGWQSR